MKKSRNSRRILMVITLFVGSMITLLPTLVHAQQEMSPDFYDPWATATVVHGPQRAVIGRRRQSSAKVAGAQRRAEKLHAKRLVSKSTAS